MFSAVVKNPADVIAALSRETHGAVSIAALEGALTEAQVRTLFLQGWIERVLPGVARVSSVPRSRRQSVAAASLWAGDASVVAARSAAELWGIDDVKAPKPEIWIRGDKRHADVHTLRLAGDRASSRRRRHNLWVASPEWTLRDLSRTESEETVEAAFEQLRRERFATLESMARNLADFALARDNHAAPIRNLVRELRGTKPCESRLEVRVARLLRAAGLERPERQFLVGDHRLDFAWPWRSVALECIGRKWHGDPADWARDLRRLSEIGAAGGFTILIATWDDTDDSTSLLAQLDQAFSTRAA